MNSILPLTGLKLRPQYYPLLARQMSGTRSDLPTQAQPLARIMGEPSLEELPEPVGTARAGLAAPKLSLRGATSSGPPTAVSATTTEVSAALEATSTSASHMGGDNPPQQISEQGLYRNKTI